MLKKRIIPCLDIQNGRTVKGINFEGIRDAGDPIELAKRYVKEGADEIVFLDITATNDKRKTICSLVEKIASEITIPFTVGGGISSLEDAHAVIQAGADKISINSAAIRRPELIQEISNRFGKQCVVVAVDIKKINEDWIVFSNGGRLNTELRAIDWCKKISQLGGGEILLTSMNNDGTKAGFALEITDQIARIVSIPVIASGGAGSIEDFKILFTQTKASAGLAASIFHYQEVELQILKNELKTFQIPIR
ncbi:MAG: imidazole glycerol phosphate synthase subunit HisF [Crocinitomicaceae bacterium]|nr:imidazole glycerol phosphate synthase subunit HisF [Flavobacteriales bacterium]NQZ34715.1 imidazole glycerol phosphate synthase subunit HisF [Crocinitomicaceae bacterium]